jgi:hypothetical protein
MKLLAPLRPAILLPAVLPLAARQKPLQGQALRLLQPSPAHRCLRLA